MTRAVGVTRPGGPEVLEVIERDVREPAPGEVRIAVKAASVNPTDDENVVEVTGLVEKPAPEDAPSNLAVLGRYVLPPAIFDAIDNTKPGSGGEIQLTDGMAALLAEGAPVHGIVYRGHRYDTGMPLGYLQAVVQIAVKRPDLGAEFRQWLTEFVAGNPG